MESSSPKRISVCFLRKSSSCSGMGRVDGSYTVTLLKQFGVYRSYFVDKYSGERVNQQTIYMTGAGYEVTLKGIKEKCRSLFLKYGKFEDPNF